MEYNKDIKRGDLVCAIEMVTGSRVEGYFKGYTLRNADNPTLVDGLVDTGSALLSHVDISTIRPISNDERVMLEIYKNVLDFKNAGDETYLGLNIDNVISQLEKELEKFGKQQQVQKHEEWSAEDKAKLEKCISQMTHVVPIPSTAKKGDVTFEIKPDVEMIEWLRALPERFKPWKPNEEQLRAVFDASERNDKLGSVLRNLYDDLKKL